MVSRGPGLLKLENQNENDCLFFDEQVPFGAWEQPCAFGESFNLGTEPGFFDFEPYMGRSRLDELNDFEEIWGDLGLWDFNLPPFHNNIDAVSLVNPNPVMIMTNNQDCGAITYHDTSTSLKPCMMHQRETLNLDRTVVGMKRQGRYKSCALELDEIQKYFDMPITMAAKELNVGLTVLKKRCRELNIMRWPHRKIKSLKSLIHNVKELGLTGEIEMLEEHKRMVETVPEMELTERTKKLRQACFKANYKKRRSLQQSTLT